jgi:N-acetylglucosamine-6-sulfatase
MQLLFHMRSNKTLIHPPSEKRCSAKFAPTRQKFQKWSLCTAQIITDSSLPGFIGDVTGEGTTASPTPLKKGGSLEVKKKVLLLSSIVLAVVLLSGAYSGAAPAAAKTILTKPNFVFILADDMRYDDLKYMPKTSSLLGEQGMSFEEAFVSNALCCPSRATIMRGQYAHNTGVWFNRNGSDGGWEGYRDHGYEQDNVATRLSDAGYRTGLFGKYLNYYSGISVPPGWVDWFAMPSESYYDYDVNDSGTIVHYGSEESDYSTDVLSEQTQQFIDESVAHQELFFAYVAPVAPHGPATPAPRDLHTYDGEQAPRSPSFNEDDVSDKPPWISSLPPLNNRRIERIDTRQENRAETLQALDDLVEGVVNKLQSTGALNNTYIFFTSDNGWESGEHRIPREKGRPYEESSRMPLLVRGPGVAAGSTTDKLALNTDFFPTLANLAGIRKPSYVDGRSLRPVLKGSAKTWRSAILLEHRDLRDPSTSRSYYGMRTSDGSKYVEYEQGFRELYDLNTDPFELSNSYDAATPPPELAARLQA